MASGPPSTCTSMWRTSVIASSRKTVGSPNAASASFMAVSTAEARSSGPCRRRSPRPPPPDAAFTNSGKPITAAASCASAGDITTPDWRSTGSPASLAASRARILLPVSSSTAGGGPTKTSPASSQAAAKSGLSERKPYPG